MATAAGLEGIQTAKINGTTLAYREQGEGEPVVFVHGALSDVRIWQTQREALAAKYRAISYSLRYHWPNDPAPPDAEHSIVEHVDDLQRLLRALGAAPAHLVGNSSGGFLCLYLATRAPERVRSLVLLEPFLLPLLVSVPPKPLELLGLAFRHHAEEVRRLPMPTLLIGGEKSPAIMHRFTEHLHALLPQAERVDIPGASHDAHVDNPSAVTDAVRQFLDRQADARPSA